MPLVFAAVVATVLGVLSLAVYRRLLVAPGWPVPVRRAALAVLAVGGVLVGVAFTASGGGLDPDDVRPLSWAGMTWLAVLFYLLLGTAVMGLASLALRLVDRGRADGPDRRRRLARVASPVVALLAVSVTGYGLAEAAAPSITPVTVTHDRLPVELEGLRIALITDLHVGPVRDASFTRRVVDAVNAQEPDLVVLGGDLVDGTVDLASEALAPIRDLDAPLGVVGVSGNHEIISREPDKWLEHWESLGVTVLRNSSVELTRAGTSFTVAGINDATALGPDAPDVDAALAATGATPEDFTLLVAHQPSQARDASGRGIDLQMSGHTHGGQLWPFRYAVLLQQPVVDGLEPVGDIPVLTSRGAGAWGPPVRVLAPPEIPLVTLEQN